jgi:hypothetical protein
MRCESEATFGRWWVKADDIPSTEASAGPRGSTRPVSERKSFSSHTARTVPLPIPLSPPASLASNPLACRASSPLFPPYGAHNHTPAPLWRRHQPPREPAMRQPPTSIAFRRLSVPFFQLLVPFRRLFATFCPFPRLPPSRFPNVHQHFPPNLLEAHPLPSARPVSSSNNSPIWILFGIRHGSIAYHSSWVNGLLSAPFAQ